MHRVTLPAVTVSSHALHVLNQHSSWSLLYFPGFPLQVVAVGSGKEDDKGAIVKPNLNKGDTVLYSKYSGTEFAQDDKQYIVIRESDVLASVQ